jgi:lysophospholipase L1-like esterase
VEIDGTAAAAPRTGRRLVVIGDSISHGFWASDVTRSWPFLVAQATGMELVNLATGGRMCVPADGTMAASCAPDVITYLIGYNEFGQQKDLVDFGARYAQTLANIRAGRPGARVLAITPLWSPNAKPIPLEAYRQAIRDAVAAAADPLVTLVEGLSLMPADPSSLTDTVHPSDAGSASIAQALAALL